jgi:hypothetical protein
MVTLLTLKVRRSDVAVVVGQEVQDGRYLLGVQRRWPAAGAETVPAVAVSN